MDEKDIQKEEDVEELREQGGTCLCWLESFSSQIAGQTLCHCSHE